MASQEELDQVGRLVAGLQRERSDRWARGRSRVLGLDSLDAYYGGVQRLEQLGLAVPDELRQFVTIANWPAVVVDALEERLDVEGFRLPGEDEADDTLWSVWQANDLDEESQLAHLDALVYGRSFVCVGANEDDEFSPLVTVESPLEMTAEIDPRTRRIQAALRVWRDNGSLARDRTEYATLYLPDATVQLHRDAQGWVEDDRDEHGLGRVPVEQLTNRGRAKQREGVTEMAPVIPLTDAAARALTNAQVATELLATPQRWLLGAAKNDFVDPTTNEQVSVWETYLGRIWSTENENAKFGQFSAADLRNFEVVVDLYAKLIAGISGTPLRYFGENTDNPPSAEGIRADEARLVKRAERRQRAFGGTWERVMRTVRLFRGEPDSSEMARMETLWRDAATPTRAQATDAVVKLWATDRYPTEAGLEDLGISQTRIRKIMGQIDAERADPALQQILAAGSKSAGAAAAQQPAADAPVS